MREQYYHADDCDNGEVQMRLTALCVAALLLAGCAQQQVSPRPQWAGPFTVVKAVFDYHTTLADKDGNEFEFRYSAYTAALGDVGSKVMVEFTGDLHATNYNNKILAVHVVQHSKQYIAEHPELWPPRKGRWKGNNYVLEDGTHRICGDVENLGDIDKGWAADTDEGVARDSIYTHYTTRQAAAKAVEKECR